MVDNLTIGSSNTSPTACVFTTSGMTMTLTADCTTDHTILVPQGYTLDGNGNSITAVDPAGDHFRGAVVKNGGTVAHVTDIEITAAGLADVCDGADDRLRWFLFLEQCGRVGHARERATVSVRGSRAARRATRSRRVTSRRVRPFAR